MMYVKFKVITPKEEKVLYKRFATFGDATKAKNQLVRLYGKDNVQFTVINKY